MVWWALFNASLIIQICPVIHEILANKDFTVTDDLISWLFVVAFVHPTYVQIALIWGFTVQLSLWKLVHWLWRYKLNEVCDIAIIWIDIWDFWSSMSGKTLINHCFNIGRHISMICGTNMNSGIPQCKNCWKWEYITFVYGAQGSRCIKCNGLHKIEHHHYFTWYYKANFKINPSQLKTKQDKLCPYTFKYLNCKGEY